MTTTRQVWCIITNKYKECDDDYVGETGRCWRERLHDHRLISHKDAKTAHTFTHQTEEQVHNLPMIGEVRRSKRISNKEKTNYFELATGGTLHTTEGSTAVAQHVTKVHDKDNIESKILTTESSWYRRGIKEALAILKHQPKLNEDHGRHPISQIYTIIPEYNIRRAEIVCAGAENPNPDESPSNRDKFRANHLSAKEKAPGKAARNRRMAILRNLRSAA